MAVFDLSKEKFSQMVDIETTSLLPTCGIIQIGACRYDIAKRKTFDDFTVNIDITDIKEYKIFDLDPATLKWWAQQDPKVIKTVFGGGGTLVDALTQFSDWVDKRYSIAAFGYLDIPSLSYAIKKVLNKDVPWDYRKVMDLRTVHLLGGGYDPSVSLERSDKHIALADCHSQCQMMFDLLNPEEKA